MRLLLIRHAAAVDPSAWKGSDEERPLTAEGRKKARAVFCRLARLYPDLRLILSSCARRAVETAELLARCIPGARVRTSEHLNPGCDLRGLRKALAEVFDSVDVVAVVGHEPDCSRLLSQMTADGRLRVEFKKAACAEVEINRLLKGELKALWPPALGR